MARGRGCAAASVIALIAGAGEARGDELLRAGVTFQAGEIEADTQLRDITLRRDVVVTYGRYRMQADELRLRVGPGGIFVDGEGRVAFCPCPDPPVAIAFSGGRVAPPGDLVVTWPRLEVVGVPVLALPWIWLRAPDRFGLLPPMIAWRGNDGLFAGAGAHLPWRGEGGAPRSLDLRVGGYSEGGVGVDGRLQTPGSTSRVAWDEVRGRRVLVDAHGSMEAGDVGLAWDVDAIRGGRARSGTIDLGAAAMPHDSLAVETSARTGAAGILATGVLARADRGRGASAAGPAASAALGGALGSAGSWEGAAGGFVVAQEGGGAVQYARAALGGELDARPGPLDVRLSSTERVRVADPGGGAGAVRDAVATARLEVRLPFVRTFEPEPGEATLAHWIVPVLEGRGAVGTSGGPVFRRVLGAVPGASWTAGGGVSTSFGRYTGRAASLDLRAGALGRADARVVAVARARLLAESELLGVAGEAAAVGSDPEALGSPAPGAVDRGVAALAHARIGRDGGLRLRVDAAAQAGGGARAARSVAAGSAASLPGEELDYLSAAGASGGADLAVPWTRSVITTLRADADLSGPDLLGLRGGIAYRHPCGCLALEAAGARRIGRGGVDVWLALDLAPPPR